MKPLYKTTIIIWSPFDGEEAELTDLAFQATEGNSYCSSQKSILVDDPRDDPDWDGTSFFDDPY
jgi:hypothetical protein